MKKITIKKNCVFCGCAHSVAVPSKGFQLWKSGELIQRAMPTVSPTEREQLISGICPECQKKFFG